MMPASAATAIVASAKLSSSRLALPRLACVPHFCRPRGLLPASRALRAPLSSRMAVPGCSPPASVAAARGLLQSRAYATPAATTFSHAAATKASSSTRATGDACRLVVVGSGWAGYTLLNGLKTKNYQVTCVSPRNYFLFTPLLAGSAVGTVEFRCLIESVGRLGSKNVDYVRGFCSDVDFERRVLHCTSNVDNSPEKQNFEIPYDILVLAPGAQPNTFGIEGVGEHATFLKDIGDARKIRTRVMDCFDTASLPGTPDSEIDRLLHFQVVGGGPTGVEFSAELHDFITDDLKRAYPKLAHRAQVTLYDVAPRILGPFNPALATYATNHFAKLGINVRTGTKVDKVTATEIVINGGEKVPFGLLVWATGITQTPFVNNMTARIREDPRKARRLMTDGSLRLLDKAGNVIQGVYALGDCAAITNNDLPATAQVASQKGDYLAKCLSDYKPISAESSENNSDSLTKYKFPEFKNEFRYNHVGSMAYVGGWRAVAELGTQKINLTGCAAWMLWRSVYLAKSVSWRNFVAVPFNWIHSWAFGREMSKFK